MSEKTTTSEHADRYDVIVVGGSYAGLSAALPLVRARKQVLIIDAGLRRNRFARSAHNLLGQDGRAPGQIALDARADIAAYPTATFVDATAVAARAEADGFAVSVADGSSFRAARLVLAIGVHDQLPDIPGLSEAWGSGVLHCPYCHGYEVAGGRLGVLALAGPTAEITQHLANLIPEWGPTTYFTNGTLAPDADEQRAALAARCAVIDGAVNALISGAKGLEAVRMEDGRLIELDALFIAAPTRLASPLAEQLGCALDEMPLGQIIRVDGFGQTSVSGVFAAGDAAQFDQSLAGAISGGRLAGTMAHHSLLAPGH